MERRGLRLTLGAWELHSGWMGGASASQRTPMLRLESSAIGLRSSILSNAFQPLGGGELLINYLYAFFPSLAFVIFIINPVPQAGTKNSFLLGNCQLSFNLSSTALSP